MNEKKEHEAKVIQLNPVQPAKFGTLEKLFLSLKKLDEDIELYLKDSANNKMPFSG